jgi:putative hydrolase of the HAD superfamily
VNGLIVDLDDTLYPHEQFVRSGFAAVAMYVESMLGMPATDVASTLSRAHNGGAYGQEFQVLCDRHRLNPTIIPTLLKIFRSHLPVIALRPGVESVLGTMKRTGWRVAILTNGLPAVQRAKVLALGLSPLVDHIVYADEHAPGGKPAASAFLEAVRRLDVPVTRCVHVGDDPVCDIAGAKALRIRTIRLAKPGVVVDPSAEADVVLDSLDELPLVAVALLRGGGPAGPIGQKEMSHVA